MTATAAPSAAPSHAIRAWVNHNSLFFELSGVNGPAVISFPRTADGFQRALAILFVRHEADPSGPIYTRPQLPSPDPSGITLEQRASAARILKKMGIL